MMNKLKVIAVLFLFFQILICNAQMEKNSDLFIALETKDSLLFEVGFNKCDLKQMEELIVEGIEFYHDKDGITTSKTRFMNSVKENLCSSGKNSTKRVLDKSSLAVFPLYKGDNLYGALQTGVHSFGSTKANFSHLWLLENKEWKISRVISYNHHQEKNPAKRELITLSNKDLKRYVGVYEFSPEFVLTVHIKGNQLYGGSQGDEVAINCYAAHKFIDSEQVHDLEFILDKKGNVTNLMMRGEGMEMKATKKK